MNQRRLLVLALGTSLASHTALLRAQTAIAGLRRIGVLAPSTAAREAVTLKPFFDQMQALGWVEGKTVVYDRGFANDQQTEIHRLAVEMVARGPDLIFAPPQPAAVAAKLATAKIPIVFATGTDPVGVGLIQSLARPGGNATGVISVIDSLAPKMVELLREVLPRFQRLGLISDTTDPRLKLDRAALAAVSQRLGFTVFVGEATNPDSLDAAIEQLVHQRVEAILTNSSLVFNLRDRLIELTRRDGVPVVGHRSEIADAGALMSYGAVLSDQLRRSARVADKILRGARPGDIPVEQPTMFEFVLNAKTARAFGIKIPPIALLRADRIIE